ncbi:hypothetical protein [Cellulomonas gilvus]|uniref:hypothetical protein n=1 Tax=Cellulomonas gilvus TaxID=11 RepID=UPI0002E057BD|nr:hypothetical protein [Cellulomonas gilvus]
MRIRLALTFDVDRSRRDVQAPERESQLDSLAERADERRIGFTVDPPATTWPDDRGGR